MWHLRTPNEILVVKSCFLRLPYFFLGFLLQLNKTDYSLLSNRFLTNFLNISIRIIAFSFFKKLIYVIFRSKKKKINWMMIILRNNDFEVSIFKARVSWAYLIQVIISLKDEMDSDKIRVKIFIFNKKCLLTKILFSYFQSTYSYYENPINGNYMLSQRVFFWRDYVSCNS